MLKNKPQTKSPNLRGYSCIRKGKLY